MVVPDSPQLHITVQLLLLLYLFSALLAGSVVAQRFTSTTVCDATTANANANRNATVVLENGTTYVVRDCTITMLFITDDNNSMYLSHDVAIVVRGGSALPVVVVRAATVRNVTMDLSDVVYDAAASAAVAVTMNTRVIFFDQIVTVENLSISLTNVQLYNALDVSIVNVKVSEMLHGLSVALMNCTLKNVTTSGLIVLKGDRKATEVSSLSFTLTGGSYSLLFITGRSDTVMMRLHEFLSLSNAVLMAHNGVAIEVTGVSNRTMTFRPLQMPRVSSMTGAVAVAAMALSTISAPSSMMRLQAIFGSLRVGRRCCQATSGASTNDDSSSESDDVGSAVFDNPLQLSIPVQDSSLRYAAGCATGNTILFLVAMILLNLRSVIIGRAASITHLLWCCCYSLPR